MKTRGIISILCALTIVTVATAQDPGTIDRADVIVVARVKEPARWDQRKFYYDDGTVVPEATLDRIYWLTGPPTSKAQRPFWMPSVPFETVLVLKGNPGKAFHYSNSLGGYPTMGKAPMLTPAGLGGWSSEDPTGKLFLLCLEKQTRNGRLPAGLDLDERAMYMESRFADEWVDGAALPVQLPEGQYLLEGRSDRERYASVIVQAYVKEPGRPQTVLRDVYAGLVPYMSKADGTKVPADPAFARFAAEKLVPRLILRPDMSLLDKIRANFWSWHVTTDTERFFPDYKRMIEELDRTWPEPNAAPSALWSTFDGLYGPESFIQSLVSARTVFLRCKAIEWLAVDRKNVKLVVDRLRVEPSFHVQLECCEWLGHLRYKEYPRLQDAPHPIREGETITNLLAIIEYWSRQ